MYTEERMEHRFTNLESKGALKSAQYPFPHAPTAKRKPNTNLSIQLTHFTFTFLFFHC